MPTAKRRRPILHLRIIFARDTCSSKKWQSERCGAVRPSPPRWPSCGCWRSWSSRGPRKKKRGITTTSTSLAAPSAPWGSLGRTRRVAVATIVPPRPWRSRAALDIVATTMPSEAGIASRQQQPSDCYRCSPPPSRTQMWGRSIKCRNASIS